MTQARARSEAQVMQVQAHARLHFDLIDLAGTLGRVDGGCGVLLDEPRWAYELSVAPGCRATIEAPPSVECEVLHDLSAALSRARQKVGGPAAMVRITKRIPLHRGLGSKTSLLMSAVAAYLRLRNVSADEAQIASLARRGGTSGIGVNVALHGGFVVDGGHRYPQDKSVPGPSSRNRHVGIPPVLLRAAFPDWPILLVTPPASSIAGEREARIFRRACPTTDADAARVSRIVLLQLVPSILEADLPSFAKAIEGLQAGEWKQAEIAAQDPVVRSARAALIDSGALCAGLSSMGPTLYCVAPNLDDVLRTFRMRFPRHAECHMRITRASNTGASLETATGSFIGGA